MNSIAGFIDSIASSIGIGTYSLINPVLWIVAIWLTVKNNSLQKILFFSAITNGVCWAIIMQMSILYKGNVSLFQILFETTCAGGIAGFGCYVVKILTRNKTNHKVSKVDIINHNKYKFGDKLIMTGSIFFVLLGAAYLYSIDIISINKGEIILNIILFGASITAIVFLSLQGLRDFLFLIQKEQINQEKNKFNQEYKQPSQSYSTVYCPNCGKIIQYTNSKYFCYSCGISLDVTHESINSVNEYEQQESERIKQERQEWEIQKRQQREQERRERERQERAKRIEEELERERQQKEHQEQQEKEQRERYNNSDVSYIQTNWHNILGVSANANAEEIKNAYRKRMSEYHPDKVAQLGEKLKIVAKIESQRINAAYAYAQTSGFA